MSFIISIGLDVYEGCLAGAKLENGVFTIKKEEWAPGMWAGCEGLVFNYQGGRYKILHINLTSRKLVTHYLGCGAV